MTQEATLVERQQVIELSQTAWQAFVQMAEAEIPATLLAKREAAAFLEEIAGQHAPAPAT